MTLATKKISVLEHLIDHALSPNINIRTWALNKIKPRPPEPFLEAFAAVFDPAQPWENWTTRLGAIQGIKALYDIDSKRLSDQHLPALANAATVDLVQEDEYTRKAARHLINQRCADDASAAPKLASLIAAIALDTQHPNSAIHAREIIPTLTGHSSKAEILLLEAFTQAATMNEGADKRLGLKGLNTLFKATANPTMLGQISTFFVPLLAREAQNANENVRLACLQMFSSIAAKAPDAIPHFQPILDTVVKTQPPASAEFETGQQVIRDILALEIARGKQNKNLQNSLIHSHWRMTQRNVADAVKKITHRPR